MKEHMLEAMKRKRQMIEQHEIDSKGKHAEGQSAQTGDDELAPASGAHERDALLGHPPAHPYLKDTRDADLQGETKLGQEQGFKHESKASAPENSKNLFHDPKHDTHDPVDLNRHRNMAGDGSNTKYDHMGVEPHKDVRKQSSKLAGANARMGEHLKDKERSFVKSKMDIASHKASSDGEAGMDAEDHLEHNEMQKGFAAPQSKVNRAGSKSVSWDQDDEGAEQNGPLMKHAGNESEEDAEGESMHGRFKGLKGARAKLDGYLSKFKKA